MRSKWALITLALVVVVGAAGYFAGTQMGGGSGTVTAEQLQEMSPEELQAVFQEMAENGGGLAFRQQGPGQGGGGPRTNLAGNLVSGSVVDKDDTSITVEQPDGSTRIVFFSDSTTVARSEAGSVADIDTGENVTVTGSTNSDGSVTAERIQLRAPGEELGPVFTSPSAGDAGGQVPATNAPPTT